MTRLRSNPWRRAGGRDTKTWLPDDAGSFGDAKTRLQTEPSEDGLCDLVLQLPDERRVALRRMGLGGMWTMPFIGADGWVYLFSAGDPMKDILAELTKETADFEWSVHLPWTEAVGWLLWRRRRSYVYRMPKYFPLEKNKATRSIIDRLVPLNAMTDWTRILAKAKRIMDKSLYEAFAALVGKLGKSHLLDDACPDISSFNIMQDAEGNIVLLDAVCPLNPTRVL